MFSEDHTFAGNPLDRAEHIRRDEEAIQELIISKEGKYLVFDRLKVHVDEEGQLKCCLLYTSPSPRDLSTSRMPSSA